MSVDKLRLFCCNRSSKSMLIGIAYFSLGNQMATGFNASWDDHAPPHFHALYAEYEVLIEIKTLEIIKGAMPRRALALILEWASQHRAELLKDWTLCGQNQLPKKYRPCNSLYRPLALNSSAAA